MHFMVTGGAGFIGSHLAGGLLNLGSVTVLDDFSTGSLANLSHLPGEDLQVIRGSITDLPFLRRACEDADCVFHLAAMASVQKSLADPLRCHEVNATGTLHVLTAAREAGVKKVIFASSAAVYGNAAVPPVDESRCPAPLTPYAASKVAGEHLCAVFSASYGLETAVLRYFNVYGPRQDPCAEYAAVIPRFLIRALSGGSPVIFGEGHQTRDFVHVGDAVRATILALQRDAVGIFNVGSGIPTTVNDLARMSVEAAGSGGDPVFEAARPGDILHSSASIARAERLLGYRPRWTLAEGLAETAAWFRAHPPSGSP
ncbi:MAG: GDP-mannose 4,6-dehydratase [Methanomicrobiales archaeon]|nr:GDP-mannose 4,6-dehydratase [Methanomicrobiales archaeon]